MEMKPETALAPTSGILARASWAHGHETRMRVVSFVPRLGFGGTERQVVGLARCFDPERFELRFGFLDPAALHETDEAVTRWPLSAYPISTFLGPGAVRQMWRFARDLRRIRPHVLHSYNFYANVFSIPAARVAGVPCVVASVRDMGVYMTPMQRRVHRQVCRLADRVAVNAEAIGSWMTSSGFPRERIRVIRNGLDLPERIGPSEVWELKGELGIPPSAQVVTMAARINPKKGIEDLLTAAVQVVQQTPETWFVIIGDVVLQDRNQDHIYLERLRTIVRELGIADRVIFTGYRRDVERVLQMSDVSVLPSWSEGLPNSVLEAMALGMPVVATRVGGIPELIEDGRTGFLVEPRDAPGLARALVAVLSDRLLARRLGEAARAQVQNKFSFHKMFRETEALYREVLANASGRRRRSRAAEIAK